MTPDAGVVTITRVFRVSVAELYGAWTDGALLQRWLVPGTNTSVGATVDVRIGGRFRLDMLDGAGAACAFSGVYAGIVPGESLSMTWRYEGPSELLARTESVLAVRFRSVDGGSSELRLEHAMLDEPLVARTYRAGWTACFDKLDRAVAALASRTAPVVYSAGQRAAQQRYGTETLAATLRRKLVRATLTEDDRAFIERRDALFLSTVDEVGAPTVSYKGGAAGFARVENGEIRFPSYDGNGMCLSIGNITGNANVGLLFVDFETPQRLRVQGVATIDDGAAGPGADCIVRIAPTAVFANCARYLHPMRRIAESAYVPGADGRTPFPSWKRIDEVVESLPERDRDTAYRLGTIGVDEYAKLLREGRS